MSCCSENRDRGSGSGDPRALVGWAEPALLPVKPNTLAQRRRIGLPPIKPGLGPTCTVAPPLRGIAR